MKLIPLWMGVLTLGACKGKIGGESGLTPTQTSETESESESESEAPTSIDLVVTLDGAAVAGDPVVLGIVVTDQDGADVTDASDVTVAASPTDGVDLDGLEVTFSQTGTFTIDVAASYDGATDTFSGSVTVGPGEPYNVDLEVDPDSLVAGGTASLTWEVIDRYGNVIPDADVVLTAEPGDTVTLGADTFGATAAGLYAVTATVGGGLDADTEEIEVVAGPAAALDLTLSAASAEVGGTVTATVVTADAYGNATEVPWTLEASPEATVASPDVTFVRDGHYTVTAAWEGLSDSEPVTVDSNGPLITILEPERGVYADSGRMTVRGMVADDTTGVASVTVNGTKVVPEKDGTFTTALSTADGPNRLDVLAIDGDGNSADLYLGYMSGEYHPDGTEMNDVVEARLTRDGLAAIATAAEGEFDPGVIESELMSANPLYRYSASCWPSDILFELSATGFGWSDLDIELDPDTGLLTVDVTVTSLDVPFEGEAEACFVDAGSFTGAIVDTTTLATLDLELDVAADGSVLATVVGSDLSFTAFDVQFDGGAGTIEDILGLIGVDIDGIAETEVRNALLPELEAAVPAALEAALTGVAIDTTFDLGGGPIDLSAILDQINLDPDGMTLSLDGTVGDGTAAPGMPSVPGTVLFNGTPRPTWPASPEMQLGLSMELTNNLLHEAWQGGMLNMSLSAADLGIDAALIGVLFPGATTLDVDVMPIMAPVLLEGAGASPIDLQLFELQLDLWGLVGGVDTHLGTVSVQTIAELDLTATPTGVELAPASVTATADMHPTDASHVASDEALEGVLEIVAVDLFPTLFAPIEIELPSLPGFSLTLSTTWTDGPWIVAGGDLR